MLKKLFFLAFIFSSALAAQEAPWPNPHVPGAMEGYQPRLEDDFYAAVNRDWLLNARLEPGYSASSSFTERDKQVQEELLSLMKDKGSRGHDAKIVQNLFSLFLDWKGREACIETIRGHVQVVSEIKNLKGLSQYLSSGESLYYGSGIFSFTVSADFARSSKSALYITPSPLTLIDADEYKSISKNGESEKNFSDALSFFALKKIGFSESQARRLIEQKYFFEKTIAPFMMGEGDLNDPVLVKKRHNYVTVADLEGLSKNLPVVQAMKAFSLDKARLIVLPEPEWLNGLAAIFTEENLDFIKAYIIDRVAREAVWLLDKEAFDFYQEALAKRNGTAEKNSYDQWAGKFVQSLLPVSCSKLYVQGCVQKGAKAEVRRFIKKIILAYEKMILQEDWLSDQTKKKAVKKLRATKIFSAYPALWEGTSSIKIGGREDGETFLSAFYKIKAAGIKKNFCRVNRTSLTPMWTNRVFQVNAFNSFSSNSIKILSGILGGDFYKSDFCLEEKMGALGVIIGHEISHSFDATGSQFDKNGNYNSWWTDDDLNAFNERSKKLVGFYDGITSLGTQRQNAVSLQGEAASDMAGMKVMLLLAGQIDDFDYKKFFTVWAKCTKMFCTNERAQFLLACDVHPFWYLRCNVTVMQFDEFQKAFGIRPGDKMWLPPEERILVW